MVAARLMPAIKTMLVVAGCLLALATAGCAGLPGAAKPHDKVVYHFSEGLEQAGNGLRYMLNELEVDPETKIVAVAHAAGVDFLLKGAKDKNGNKYEDRVERLALSGVRFEVCEITLRERRLSKAQFIDYATFVPSGVAEIVRLQQREGYAYLKP
jgi:intracellular sulfur oxidation DsrE/DsrF family protein